MDEAMKERRGGWIQTVSGKPFWPLDPRMEEIDINDIAWALSMICRWNGHCKTFMSVGEHSLRVMERAPEELKLAALLHDAAEAYIGDVSRVLKCLLEYNNFRETERQLMALVGEKYGVTPGQFQAVKIWDNTELGVEALSLMAPLHLPMQWQWCTNLVPDGDRLRRTHDPLWAKDHFLNAFHRLTEGKWL